MWLTDKGDGTGFVMMLVDYVKEWWPYRKQKNVHFLHYVDRIKDPEGDIESFAKFLDIKLTPEQKATVVEKSGFKYMKKFNTKFSYCLGQNDAVQQIAGKIPDGLCAIEPDGFVSKGKDRNGEKEMDAAIVEATKKICVEHLGQAICDWLKSGGPMPDVEVPK